MASPPGNQAWRRPFQPRGGTCASTPPVPDPPPAPVGPWHASRDSQRGSPAGMGRGRRVSADAPLAFRPRPPRGRVVTLGCGGCYTGMGMDMVLGGEDHGWVIVGKRLVNGWSIVGQLLIS